MTQLYLSNGVDETALDEAKGKLREKLETWRARAKPNHTTVYGGCPRKFGKPSSCTGLVKRLTEASLYRYRVLHGVPRIVAIAEHLLG